MNNKGSKVDFCATVKWDTDDALLLTDGINEFWIPKSQIIEQDPISDSDFEFVIPEWLAKEKGIV